jgi:hypothetical protein
MFENKGLHNMKEPNSRTFSTNVRRSPTNDPPASARFGFSRQQVVPFKRMAQLVVAELERRGGRALVPPALVESGGKDRLLIFRDRQAKSAQLPGSKGLGDLISSIGCCCCTVICCDELFC